ncbi:MAG: DNA polymerase III subunit alpha [Bacillota bacterium]|nr:DNA polymerase III subunit alpha [Bacillota bacterium]
MEPGFVHLHVHSAYSFLDGGSTVRELVAQAAELGLPALAVTDHHNVSAAVELRRAAQEVGLKPLIGAEVTLDSGAHLVLLARTAGGYANLCRLLSEAWQRDRLAPRLRPGALDGCCEGLVALSGCRRGEIPALLLQGRYREAREAAARLAFLFGRENFYLELQQTLLPRSRALNALLAELAERLDLGLIATNNVHYARKEGFPRHDLLTCVRTHTTLDDVHGERPLNAENYLKSAKAMRSLFRAYPEACDATVRLAGECDPVPAFDRPLIPRFTPPGGETSVAFLRRLVYDGARSRYGRVAPPLAARLDHELDLITRLGFADYFLVVWDVVRFARAKGIRLAGRGSAADSAVCYCLGFTEVDSFGRGLLFERFLSLERAQKPDIDVDFDARRRDEVAAYLYQKYGAERVGSVCTFQTFQARSAIRELGQAMGFDPVGLDRLAKLFPYFGAQDLTAALTRLPELRESGLPMARYARLFEFCQELANFPRFYGTHLGGLVVSREPLHTVTPLIPSAKGPLITQFDKDSIEDLGLIKLDLLSLRTLSAVEDAVAAIRARDPHFDYDRLPLADRPTYAQLRRGETIGLFQLESPAQRALQARLGATGIEDVVASVALIRPGPIEGNLVEPFIRRRLGQESVTYLDPRLEPILAKTYGVVLFQEQVIEIATVLAGFTPGESDRLRKVMTHARSRQEMAAIGEEFVARTVRNGVAPEVAQEIFGYLAGYAGYGFCEAHAAAFGTTAYKTAYLSCHYPAQFFAALLNNQPMGFYPPNTLCMEARRRGIALLPPDVNASSAGFTAGDKTIRVGLKGVKDLGEAAVQALLAARRERPFASWPDFRRRVPLNRGQHENLIAAGAFDSLYPNRRQLLWTLALGEEEVPASLAGLADFPPREKALLEYSALGLNVEDHFLSHYRPALRAKGILSSRQVTRARPGTLVTVGGLVIRPHRPPVRSGRIVVFFSLEDEFGLTDVTVFEPVYQRCGKAVFTEPALAVKGRVDQRGNARSVIAHEISPLSL